MSDSMMAENLIDLSSESDSEDEFDELILLYSLSKEKKTWKSNFMKKRQSHGEFNLSSEFSDKQFLNYFRLDRNQFNEVLNLIRDTIYSFGCNAQKPIDPEEKLAIFLRYLASGDSYKSIAYSYRMGDRTVSKIINEVATAIWNNMQPIYLPEPTMEMWKLIANEFEHIWQFPHCIGALDGKHIVIKKPPKSGTSFYNYKQTFSVVLMAIVDAHYKFISIDIGSMGRFSDANIFSSGALAKKLNKQTLRLPPPAALTDYDQILPYAFVADEAFPLSENIMRPYPNRSVTNNFKNKVFNYRLSRARQTVECTFGILASRFRVFRRPFETKIESVDNVVKAACVLHNYLRNETIILNNMQGDSSENEMPENQLLPLTNNNTRSGSNAFCVRQKFTDYFNTVGSVPWQSDSVSRGKY